MIVTCPSPGSTASDLSGQNGRHRARPPAIGIGRNSSVTQRGAAESWQPWPSPATPGGKPGTEGQGQSRRQRDGACARQREGWSSLAYPSRVFDRVITRTATNDVSGGGCRGRPGRPRRPWHSRGSGCSRPHRALARQFAAVSHPGWSRFRWQLWPWASPAGPAGKSPGTIQGVKWARDALSGGSPPPLSSEATLPSTARPAFCATGRPSTKIPGRTRPPRLEPQARYPTGPAATRSASRRWLKFDRLAPAPARPGVSTTGQTAILPEEGALSLTPWVCCCAARR